MKANVASPDLQMNGPARDLAMDGKAASPDLAMEMKSPMPDLAMQPPPPDLAMKPAPPDLLPMPGVDPFGVKEIHPTAGREWFLPATADQPDSEWQPGIAVTKVQAGVFEVSGAPRMMVVSPHGKDWWRNVEMTGYLRETGTVNFYLDQVPHWEFFARGEQHSNDAIAPGAINRGVSAPQGTVTWPGYPWNGQQTIDQSCLASCYHGHLYPDGRVLFEKEISHTEGYVFGLGRQQAANFADAMNRWVGFKFIVRNEKGDSNVKIESWVDKDATGNWVKVSEADDVGNWIASNANVNGCTAGPLNYKTNQIITWAGPWVSFRVDNMSYQFKELSVREIAPLP